MSIPYFRLAVLLALATSASGQVRPAWTVIRDSPAPTGRDQGFVGLHVAPNGEIVLVEALREVIGANGDFDVLIARYDSAGALLSETVHDFAAGPSSENPKASIVDSTNGEIVVIGEQATFTGSGQLTEYFVARMTATGTLVSSAPALSAACTGLVESGASIYAWNFDHLARLAAPAAVVWSRSFAANIEVWSVVPAPAGDLYLVEVNTTTPGLQIERIQPTNTVAWASILPSPAGAVSIRGATTDAAGNLFVCGWTVVTPPSSTLGWVTSFAPDGSLRWSTTIAPPAPGPLTLGRVRVDAFGRVLVAGGIALGQQRLYEFDDVGTLVGQVVTAVSGGSTDVEVDPRGNAAVLLQSNEPGEPLDMRAVGVDSALGVRWRFVDTGVIGASQEFANALVPFQDGWLLGTQSNGALGSDTVLVRLVASVRAYCFGDGSGAVCPCGNNSAPVLSAGCMNSLVGAGRLVASGDPSLSVDTLILEGSGMPNGPVLYVQATSFLPATPFGDGFFCSGGQVVRLGIHINNASGASTHPTGGATISSLGNVTTPGLRAYFAWYRDAAAFCTSATFNVTNALEVTWGS